MGVVGDDSEGVGTNVIEGHCLRNEKAVMIEVTWQDERTEKNGRWEESEGAEEKRVIERSEHMPNGITTTNKYLH